MKNLIVLTPLIGLLLQAQTPQPQTNTAASSSDNCVLSDLSLGTDSEHGAFDKPGRSGTLLVLRNVSSKPCKLLGAPRITFADDEGALKVAPFNPFVAADGTHRGRGHGPAIPWIVIPSGAEVTSQLSWSIDDRLQGAGCVKATKLILRMDDASSQSTPLSATLCSSTKEHGIVYGASSFVRDPILR